MFDVALDALAPRGKLLVIGMMSQVRRQGAREGRMGAWRRMLLAAAQDGAGRRSLLLLPLTRSVAHLLPRCPYPLALLQYGTGWQDRQYPRLAEKLLWKSASVQVGGGAERACGVAENHFSASLP